jgi:hypothetical protein
VRLGTSRVPLCTSCEHLKDRTLSKGRKNREHTYIQIPREFTFWSLSILFLRSSALQIPRCRHIHHVIIRYEKHDHSWRFQRRRPKTLKLSTIFPSAASLPQTLNHACEDVCLAARLVGRRSGRARRQATPYSPPLVRARIRLDLVLLSHVHVIDDHWLVKASVFG